MIGKECIETLSEGLRRRRGRRRAPAACGQGRGGEGSVGGKGAWGRIEEQGWVGNGVGALPSRFLKLLDRLARLRPQRHTHAEALQRALRSTTLLPNWNRAACAAPRRAF